MIDPVVGINVDLGKIIPEFKSSYEKFKESKSYNKESYNELLGKYAEAIKVIEQLKLENDPQKKKLPTKEEVESMSAMLDMFKKLDPNTINKLNKFRDKQ